MKSFVENYKNIKPRLDINHFVMFRGCFLYRYRGIFNTIGFIESVRKNFNFEYTGCIYHDYSNYNFCIGGTRTIPEEIIPPCTLNFCNGSYNGYNYVSLYFTNHLENGEVEDLIFEFDTREQYNGFDFLMLKHELNSKSIKSNKLFGELYIKSDTQSFIDECKSIVKVGR